MNSFHINFPSQGKPSNTDKHILTTSTHFKSIVRHGSKTPIGVIPYWEIKN